MSNLTAAQIKNALNRPGAPSFDSVRISKGTVICRWGYFYRHGQTAEALRDRVIACLKAAGLNDRDFAVEATDHFHAWPKDSWLQVQIFPQSD